MALRAAPALAALPLSWVDLPTLPHPQYVNDEGYEVAALPNGDETAVQAEGHELEGTDMIGEVDESVDPIDEQMDVDVDAEPSERLLDVSERYAHSKPKG
jgi:hypothetical protein